MRKFTIGRFIIFTLIVLLSSCVSEYILDPIDHRLPIYSETGNNVSGAIINNELWNSRATIGDKNFDIEINTDLNKLSFNFFGESTTYTYISIVIENPDIKKYEDLKQLSGKKFILNSQNNFAVISKNFIHNERRYTPTESNGQIYIKNVNLSYDELNKKNEIIISGTFGFEVKVDNKIEEVHYGRFDYKITDEYFRTVN